MRRTDKRYKGMVAATKPRGRNKPMRKKLAQSPTHRAGYATPVEVRYIEPQPVPRVEGSVWRHNDMAY